MPTPKPEYLICFECEAPCSAFEWDEARAKIVAARCPGCGNDQVDAFALTADFSGEE